MSWAVITGASSGLGAIFADQLAKRGHSLVLAGRDEARLKAVAHRIDQNVELVVGDLGTTKGVEDLITQLANREIDVLVNNAGFGTYGPFAEIDAEREHELVAVNVDALVRLTHAAAPPAPPRPARACAFTSPPSSRWQPSCSPFGRRPA